MEKWPQEFCVPGNVATSKRKMRDLLSCLLIGAKTCVAGTPPAVFLPSSGLSEAGHMPISELGTGEK